MSGGSGEWKPGEKRVRSERRKEGRRVYVSGRSGEEREDEGQWSEKRMDQGVRNDS